MSPVTLQFLGIPLARDTDHKPEFPSNASLHSGDGILDDNGPSLVQPPVALPRSKTYPGRAFRLSLATSIGSPSHPHLEEVI